MQITDENPQDWQKNWAVELKAMRLSNGDRAYDKTGMHLVMVGLIDGKEVPITVHLSKLDAINLSLVLTAEVSREMTQWPNGYSDEERIAWHEAERAAALKEGQRIGDQVADEMQARNAPRVEGEPQ